MKITSGFIQKLRLPLNIFIPYTTKFREFTKKIPDVHLMVSLE